MAGGAKNIAVTATRKILRREMTSVYRDSVHGVVLSGLTRYLERNGYSLDEFRRLSGVGAEESNDPDARVPIETMVRSWKAALGLTENPALGLAVGADYSSISHGILGHLVSHSDTLGDALRVLCRYQRLLSGGDFLELAEDRGEASLTYHADDPDPELWPTVVERAFASIVTVATSEAMGRFALRAAEFDYPKPRHSSAYSALFAAPCRFGAPKSRLIFPRSHLGLRMRNRHSSLHAVLSREVEATHPGLVEDRRATRARLWNTLPSLLDRGAVSVGDASKALGLSERTLHRRLSLEGATYSELLDKARFERSIRLMAAPDASIEEIAMDCGFLDNSGFYRALKRWTGMTPRAYRRHLRTKRRGVPMA
jgi:AraC-like DNA-binding protein